MSDTEAIFRGFQIAIKAGIAGSADELRPRNIVADLDLLDASKNTIPRGWKQPVTAPYATAEVDTLIYGNVQNSQDKVIIFTGVQNLQREVYTASIRFDRGGVEILGIEGTQDLESYTDQMGSKQFSRPYIFAPREQPMIYFHPTAEGVGKQDKIALLGTVIERSGTTTA